MKNKTTALVLAIFFGGLGAHKFYLGSTRMGFIYIVFCVTGIPSIIAIYDAFIIYKTPENMLGVGRKDDNENQETRLFDLENDELPANIKSQLINDEVVKHFEYIPIQKEAGCGSNGETESGNNFIMISDKRILYEATINQSDGDDSSFEQDSGTIPIDKVSFVKTTKTETKEGGCAGNSYSSLYILKVNSGGGQINIAIPTKEATDRAKSAIENLIL
tara:strand:+ start:648 stop:1301 length:654 start_codon:yes stop_codon:yes gene_type:complete